MTLDRFEILFGIQTGGAFDEDVERIGGDDVKFLASGEQVVARVVVDDVRTRVIHNIVILRAEISRRNRRNDGLDFANGDFLNARVGGESTGGYAGSEADSQYRLRMRMEQSRQMSDHSLEFHVVRFGGGFDVTVDVDADGSVTPARNGHRRISPFRGVNDGRLPESHGALASIGDHFAGYWLYDPRQERNA